MVLEELVMEEYNASCIETVREAEKKLKASKQAHKFL